MARSYSDKSTLNGDLESQATAPDLGGDVEEARVIKKVASENAEKPTIPSAFALDDPDNPKNMPSWKKYLVSIVSSLMVLVLTYSSSAYVSEKMRRDKVNIRPEVSKVYPKNSTHR